MKKKYYIFTALISYFVLLIATVPAKPVTDLVNENTEITITGVQGSLWNGKAYAIDLDGYAELRDTQWSFLPWKIFTGEVAAELSTNFLDNEISTQAGVSFTGHLHINNLTARIEANQLAELASIPLVQLDGLLTMDIKSARWKPGELPMASGTVNWSNAKVTVAEAVQLGNIAIILSESEQQTLAASISNKGGELTISGSAELIPEQDYAIDLKLSPTAKTKNSVRQSLGMFAKKQKNGDYLLKNTGSINQLGLM